MAHIIAIANQKGGVGKTTTAINLGVALVMAGRTCLVVDGDPQCNATTGFGLRPLPRHPWLSPQSLDQLVSPTEEGVTLLPGSPCRQDADKLSALPTARFRTVVSRLRTLAKGFDFALIDCPPSLGKITQIALHTADTVLVPLQCEYFAMEGLAQMCGLIEFIRKQRGQQALPLLGILLNQFDPSWQIAHEVVAEVRSYFPQACFKTVIPREQAVSEATSHGHSVVTYSPRARATLAYAMLTVETLYRCDSNWPAAPPTPGNPSE